MLLPYADTAPRESGRPWVTWALVAANVLVFLQQIQSMAAYEHYVLNYGFVPARASLLTAVSCMFLHGDLMHLLGNMWFLWIFGDNVELRVGRWTYLALYLLSGLGGAAAHYVFFSQSNVPTIGASGAIFGVMGMYLFLFPHNRVKFFYFFFILIGTFQVPAVWAIGFWFAKEVFFSYITTSSGMEGGIGHLAHAGGLAAGFVLIKSLMLLGVVRDDGHSLWAWLTDPNERGARRFRTMAPEREVEALRSSGDWPARAPEKVTVQASIVELLRRGREADALRMWDEHAPGDPTLVLPPSEMLALCQLLDRAGERAMAYRAYVRLLKAYPDRQPITGEGHLGAAKVLLDQMRHSGRTEYRDETAWHLQNVLDHHPDLKQRDQARLWMATLR